MENDTPSSKKSRDRERKTKGRVWGENIRFRGAAGV